MTLKERKEEGRHLSTSATFIAASACTGRHQICTSSTSCEVAGALFNTAGEQFSHWQWYLSDRGRWFPLPRERAPFSLGKTLMRSNCFVPRARTRYFVEEVGLDDLAINKGAGRSGRKTAMDYALDAGHNLGEEAKDKKADVLFYLGEHGAS